MKLKFTVTGMSCAACSAAVTRAVKKVNGVSDVSVNLLAGEMTVTAERDETPRIIAAVHEAGYGALVYEPGRNDAQIDADKRRDDLLRRFILSAVLLVPLMYVAMAGMGLPLPSFIRDSALLFSLCQFIPALCIGIVNRDFFIGGYGALFRLAPNMNSLVALGCTASGLYGTVNAVLYCLADKTDELPALWFESFAMILTLVTLGKFLESRAKKKTTDSVSRLMDLAPKTALIRRDGKEMRVDAKDVLEHDTVTVRAGEGFCVDGTVTAGSGLVDTSVMTGESLPREALPGDTVHAGTVLLKGYLEYTAEKVGSETALAGIVSFVRNAAASKAPVQRLADRVCGWFVPAVMGIALVTGIVWLLIGAPIKEALTYAVSVLVVACPCALGIATPVAVAVGTAKGAEKGILIRDAEALETLAHADTVVFDKTGTLTVGSPEITRVVCFDAPENEVIAVCASAEQYSEHPLASAVLRRAEGLTLSEASAYETLPGRGIRAVINGKTVIAGNEKLMEEEHIAFTVDAHGDETPVLVAGDAKPIGILYAADRLRPTSADAADAIKRLGIKTVMLTGDREKTALCVAEKAHIERVIASVLPKDKSAEIVRLQQQNRRVVMVGDGLNDAPALAAADVGIAVGNGADIAMDAADVILVEPGVTGVVHAIGLGRATMRIIKIGLFWAFFYNVIGIVIATGLLSPLGITMTPAIAAAAMSLSSVTVVTNALRLKRHHFYGFKEEGIMEIKLKVTGMHCEHCKAAVEKALAGVDGVMNVQVDLKKGKAAVKASDTVETDSLIAAVRAAGFDAKEA